VRLTLGHQQSRQQCAAGCLLVVRYLQSLGATRTLIEG
jgi:hypothetical protein